MIEVPSSASLSIAPEHLLDRHRLRKVVVLVAIGAGEIAAAHGDHVRQDRVLLVRASPQAIMRHSRKRVLTKCCARRIRVAFCTNLF